MQPQDIERLIEVGTPTVSPDGAAAVFATSRPDLGADAAVGQLWRIALPDGAPARLTRGFSDSAPRFSPDGSRIAFLRAEREDPPQLMVMTATGGEPLVVTDAKLGVREFAWSPDGRTVAYIAREPEDGRYGTVDGLDGSAEPPRRIVVQRYRSNGAGYILDKPARLFVVEVPDPAAEPVYGRAPRAGRSGDAPTGRPEPQRLSTGDGDVSSPVFTADGSAVLVIGALHESRDTDLVSDVYRVPVDGGEPVRVTDGRGDVGAFAVAAQGDELWTVGTGLGESRTDFVGRGSALTRWRDGVPERITDATDLDLGDGIEPIVTPDGVLVTRRAHGAVDLLRIGDDGSITALTEGVEVVAAAAAGGRIVVSIATPDSFGELALVDGGLHLLTDFGAGLREAGVSRPRELTVTARDGHEVHGWVTVPAGEGPHPVLLMIHGGPFSQYSLHVFDETQVLAAAGYAVVQCNPRGSAGYGEAHARAIRHAMGTVDFTDVIDFLDTAIAQVPGLDGARTGVLGGSYGGYLTAWTIAHDHRFAAAIVERGYLDPEQFVGTSDIGSFFSDEYVGTDPEQVAAQSPQAHAAAVTTPTLVIHSEQDLRCPLPQAERYYATLKRQGTPAELLIFPGENHELSRSGRPSHRTQRFDAMLDWWGRYLPIA